MGMDFLLICFLYGLSNSLYIKGYITYKVFSKNPRNSLSFRFHIIDANVLIKVFKALLISSLSWNLTLKV